MRFKLLLSTLVWLIFSFRTSAAPTYISTSVTYSSSAVFTDDIIIQSTGTLNILNVTISFTAGKGIIVEEGGTLSIQGSILTVSGAGKWKGVTLNHLTTNSGHVAFMASNNVTSIISFATIGIYSEDLTTGGTGFCPGVSCPKVNFASNDQHLVFFYTSNNLTTSISTQTFSNCNFNASTSSDPIMLDYLEQLSLISCKFASLESGCNNQVHIDATKNLLVQGCTFNSSKNSALSLHYQVTNAMIETSTFNVSSLAKSGTCITGLTYGCIVFCSPSATINTNVTIRSNSFSVASSSNTFVGILMPNIGTTYSVNDIDIRDNTFTNFHMGIRASSCNGTSSIIKGNTFNNFNYAISSNDDNSMLGVYCNTFQNPNSATSEGISIAAGSQLKNLGPSDARNIFNGTFKHIYNHSTTFTWTYPLSGSIGDPFIIVGLVNTPATMTDINCAALRTADPSMQTATVNAGLQLTLLPNPADNDVEIQLNDPAAGGTVNVYDLSGKKVLSSAITSGEHLDISALQAGIYIIEFNTSSTTLREKLIVQ